MIRTEAEYQAARTKAAEQSKLIKQQEKQLQAEGLKPDQIKRALDPMRSFTAQIDEEIQSYENLKRGEFAELQNLNGMGELLIGIRIALGLSQRELAERLDVHETQVSRDERNEYFGVTVDRASRILEALDVEVTTTVRRLPSLAKSISHRKAGVVARRDR
jgi:ribosome-binding protein aMBF1 (putative translation factor)